ncbi:bifunctional nicotinamide-nucleotide adenylyltransferase/Nudix hydroxylase [Francisella sp. Scap27]|uniref:bifunctional nicotinamide-nucleotide adenylyltransferase/Nudix hydroxylase n=1 Tax=Francisella sp. Scap27 TaxID=2589986 RepID=UPI0015BFBDD8|nr:bifunctional nicotinamide-nucleotide adenylyltransferase/Nudix hydroxylase [Francisella sp. Scap27]QLE78888.1 bifunctional nicotinamide-nucleotide adenylyltransferase/Nudix hydroxylase [Francisella sp. Scap27]
MYNLAVFVGRFQPFHKGHLHNVIEALNVSEKLLIIIGSSFNSPNIKNPFSFEQRKKMIKEDLKYSSIDLNRIKIEPLADYFYQEEKWEQALRNNVSKHSDPKDKVAIIGHDKDESSYYLKSFSEWGFVPVTNYKNYNATDFRQEFYQGNILIEYMCANTNEYGTHKFLSAFLKTDAYNDLITENQYVIEYKKSWQNAPYKPNLVTVDALVMVNNHILLVQRKNSPGKNQWAMPGGFLECHETILSAILRELKEETSIELTIEQLELAKNSQEVFDYPSRSVRGRTISHAAIFILDEWPDLPNVKAADDAKDVKWFSLATITTQMYDKMLEDHYQMINVLLERCNRNI